MNSWKLLFIQLFSSWNYNITRNENNLSAALQFICLSIPLTSVEVNKPLSTPASWAVKKLTQRLDVVKSFIHPWNKQFVSPKIIYI